MCKKNNKKGKNMETCKNVKLFLLILSILSLNLNAMDESTGMKDTPLGERDVSSDSDSEESFQYRDQYRDNEHGGAHVQRSTSAPQQEIMKEVYRPRKKNTSSMPNLTTLKNEIKSAITTNNIDKLKKLINKKTCCMSVDDYENTPLHYACMHKMTNAVRFLLNDDRNPHVTFKVAIDQKNMYGETALHIAATQGDIKTVELLLGHGASLTSKADERTRVGQTPLQRAVAGRSLSVIHKLVAIMEEKKLYNVILQSDSIGNTALHEAAGLGQYEATKFLAGAFLNALNERSYFFKKKISDVVNMRNPILGTTPLISVAADKRESGNVEGGITIEREKIAQFLIANDAQIDAKDKDGRTALDWANHHKHAGLIEVLENAQK